MEHFSAKYGMDQDEKNLLSVSSKILGGCIPWNLKLVVIIVQKYICWQWKDFKKNCQSETFQIFAHQCLG